MLYKAQSELRLEVRGEGYQQRFTRLSFVTFSIHLIGRLNTKRIRFGNNFSWLLKNGTNFYDYNCSLRHCLGSWYKAWLKE